MFASVFDPCIVCDWAFVGYILVQVSFLVVAHGKGKNLGNVDYGFELLECLALAYVQSWVGMFELEVSKFREFVFVVCHFVEVVFVGYHFVGFAFAGCEFDCSVHEVGGSGFDCEGLDRFGLGEYEFDGIVFEDIVFG